MIEVKDLVKRYGGFCAVDHLSFTVKKGQIYGFLGPNGAGKSTTMNMITGYLAPTEGRVLIDGYDMFLEPEQAKHCIGYLPEIPPVYPEMTPEEYLAFAAELKGISKKERKKEVERVMELTGITSMRRRLIGNLSKGYRQRVGFSCALLGDPQVIILDEPTVGLDPRQIIDIRNLIQSLRQKHTVILSSHILSEVSAVCDHILIIAKGTLAASGTPKELADMMQSANLYDLLVRGEPQPVKELLGQVPGVRRLTVSEHSSGLAAVHIETADTVDPRAAVFRLLAKADYPIMELTSKSMSLEDVFLELTEQGRFSGGKMAGVQKAAEGSCEEGGQSHVGNL